MDDKSITNLLGNIDYDGGKIGNKLDAVIKEDNRSKEHDYSAYKIKDTKFLQTFHKLIASLLLMTIDIDGGRLGNKQDCIREGEPGFRKHPYLNNDVNSTNNSGYLTAANDLEAIKNYTQCARNITAIIPKSLKKDTISYYETYLN